MLSGRRYIHRTNFCSRVYFCCSSQRIHARSVAINERGSAIARSNVFNCPCRQLGKTCQSKTTYLTFLSSFVDSINVFDRRLFYEVFKYLTSMELPNLSNANNTESNYIVIP